MKEISLLIITFIYNILYNRIDMKKKLPLLVELFIVFFKVGLFTFGGGYAMIPIIEEEICAKRKWLTQEEMFDILAIAESTPGPIAVNSATYVGYKMGKVWGSIIATLGLVLPSFTIIFLISLCYEQFMKWTPFIAMFKGIKVAVIILLLRAVLKLKKGVKFNTISIILFVSSLVAVITLSILNIEIPMFSLMLIALGIIVGIVIELLHKNKEELK